MMLLGTLVNCFAVIAGSGIGLLVKKGISEKISTSIMNALALCVLYIGVKGAFECQNVLVVIVSMALGTFIGEWLDLDARLDGLGQRLENSLGKGKEKGSISSGFVAASLLFCVGAMMSISLL